MSNVRNFHVIVTKYFILCKVFMHLFFEHFEINYLTVYFMFNDFYISYICVSTFDIIPELILQNIGGSLKITPTW